MNDEASRLTGMVHEVTATGESFLELEYSWYDNGLLEETKEPAADTGLRTNRDSHLFPQNKTIENG